MDLIILPGNSENNKSWAQKLRKNLHDSFSEIKILYYQHWKSEEKLINLDHELSELEKLTPKNTKYLIIAKSAGTFLTALGVYKEKINPEKCIFLGTPLAFAPNINFDVNKYFANFPIPTLFIQQYQDPVTPYSELESFLSAQNIPNYNLIKINGNDHAYADYSKIQGLVKQFINKW